MIPPTAEFDTPFPCRIDYFDESDVIRPVVGWSPNWLYVLEGESFGLDVVCIVAWENVARFEAERTLL